MADGVDYWKTADGVDLRELTKPFWVVLDDGIEQKKDWFMSLLPDSDQCGIPVMDRYDEDGNAIPMASAFASSANAAASFAERRSVAENAT